ncbi:phosphonate degradation HD-domain oxygenase [Dyella caseinilytica]|uniref:HD domain-containing protein n=1 Tax=Dyella caseinilytica TaxID=1849581 RepID=A0ABX7GWB4_9GAMM|nr:phosphonate degradation HD-domain oxygenase [Dyella caseinilytica]QRN54775.1 HD domain-containing protein [Dyella caseinilytica]GFZ96749.1 phosphohydrolase [Dyella caseinilytica]
MAHAKHVDQLLDLLSKQGESAYFGEPVSVLEHCLQCAHFAEQSHASPSTIVAALLHDIGHVLHGLPEDIAQHGLDGAHEEVAATYLARWFGEDVTETVRLHVAAKRYLCATDSAYISRLSPASIESLQLQGGPMSNEEVAAFEALPNARVAVQLRRWDDEAKIPKLDVPGLAHYRPILVQASTAGEP